jgi:CheY-like chemotaxis protein
MSTAPEKVEERCLSEQAPNERRERAWNDQRPFGERLLRVLIVDDDPDCAESLSLLTGFWGHEAKVAHTAAAALESAVREPPDVVISDLALPLMDGCDLARALRREPSLKSALLIAITGYGDLAHRLLCQEAGFNLFLVKPVKPQTLESLLLLARDWLTAPLSPSVSSRAYGILLVDEEHRNGALLNPRIARPLVPLWP